MRSVSLVLTYYVAPYHNTVCLHHNTVGIETLSRRNDNNSIIHSMPT